MSRNRHRGFPHSADGNCVAPTQRGEFSAGGLRKAPPDSALTRVPRGERSTARPLLSLLFCPCFFFCHGTAMSVRVITHFNRRSLTLRTLCYRRERDHDPPAVLARNVYWRLMAVYLINRTK